MVATYDQFHEAKRRKDERREEMMKPTSGRQDGKCSLLQSDVPL
jgi:hypothetical protein